MIIKTDDNTRVWRDESGFAWIATRSAQEPRTPDNVVVAFDSEIATEPSYIEGPDFEACIAAIEAADPCLQCVVSVDLDHDEPVFVYWD